MCVFAVRIRIKTTRGAKLFLSSSSLLDSFALCLFVSLARAFSFSFVFLLSLSLSVSLSLSLCLFEKSYHCIEGSDLHEVGLIVKARLRQSYLPQRDERRQHGGLPCFQLGAHAKKHTNKKVNISIIQHISMQ